MALRAKYVALDSGLKDIKEILITIKKLKENKEHPNVLEKYFKKLFETFNLYRKDLREWLKKERGLLDI